VETVVESGLSPDFNRRKEELELYPLDSLRMVGTLEQEGVTWGLVQTKDGTIHRVASGNYMGQNHGRVVHIAEDQIKLVELVKIGSNYQEQEAALALGEIGN
jgi:type IV pilus assembly protein PilP